MLRLLFSRPDWFKSLQGKHVIVTESCKGSGFSLAKRCLAEGAFVTLMAVKEADLRKAAEELVEAIGCPADRILLKAVDVAEAAEVMTAIEEAFQWRPIDILICNAAIAKTGLLEDVPCEDLERILRINYLGSVYPVRAALPLMKQRSLANPSSIIFINSISSVFTAYASNMYTISKYAQKGFAECLRLELIRHNIAVHLVKSGYIETGIMNEYEEFATANPFWGRLRLVESWNLARTADEFAGLVIADVKRGGDFVINIGRVAFLLCLLGREAYPPESVTKLAMELLFTVPLRLLTFYWAHYVKSLPPCFSKLQVH